MRRKGDDADAAFKEETDSVEAQFGGEFSEDTLDLVRGYDKPEWLEEPSVGRSIGLIVIWPDAEHA